jgi:tetratricopeptide (TPR) repeat protein
VLRRHQTLRATLEWSHGLLTPDEQTVLRRLGVFAGSFTLEAAQRVVSDERIDPWAALDHLGALVDKSLVLADGDPLPRYRLLETTRAYALERLGEAAETTRMLRRHAEALLALLAAYETDGRLWQARRTELVAATAELDNLRAALAWVAQAAEGADLVVPLAGASFHVWAAAFQLVEGLDRCLALRHHVDDTVPPRARALYWLTLARLGLYSMRRESYEGAMRAAELFRELGDDSRRYEALMCAGVQGLRFASTAEMGRSIAEATQLERAEWPARQRASLQYARCWWYAGLGRYDEALACAQRQASINRDGGNAVAEQFSMSNVAAVELLLGLPEAALEHARVAIERLDALGAGDGAGHLYLNAMIALILLGRLDEAAVAARAAHARLLQEGDEYRLFAPLALLAALRGRAAAAARIVGRDDAVHAHTGESVRPNAAQLRARVDPLLAAALPAPEFASLRAEGAAMRDEQVFKLGFDDGR